MAYRRLEVDFGIWGTVRKTASALIVIALLGGFALWYVPILKQTGALQRDIEIKRQALKKQQELHQRYNEEIQALKSNPEAVERAVRETLKLAKPNETIYHFELPRPEK